MKREIPSLHQHRSKSTAAVAANAAAFTACMVALTAPQRHSVRIMPFRGFCFTKSKDQCRSKSTAAVAVNAVVSLLA